MSAREEVLAGIRDALRRSPVWRGAGEDGRREGGRGEEDREGPEGDASASGPIPARARLTGEDRVRVFIDQATAVDTTVDRVASTSELPGAVAAYLDDADLGPAAAVHGRLGSLAWEAAGVDPDGDPEDDAGPAVLPAFGGVAETGSVCLTSNEAPLRAAFLPDALIVALREADLAGSYEELWARGRRAWDGGIPSSLVLVAGPSRTADIQQTLVLGAHGPRRLHVVLVRGRPRSEPG